MLALLEQLYSSEGSEVMEQVETFLFDFFLSCLEKLETSTKIPIAASLKRFVCAKIPMYICHHKENLISKKILSTTEPSPPFPLIKVSP